MVLSVLKMEAVRLPETQMNSYWNTWCQILEQWHSIFFFVHVPPDGISLQLCYGIVGGA
jgi:hypothetical protein